MRAVDLNDRFNDPLFHPLHPVKFFIQDPSGLLRVDGFEIIVFPLNIHHDRQRALRMASLFRGNLIGTRHRQISSGPEPNIVRQRPACTGHEIRDALQAGEFHLVTGLFLVFIFLFLRRRAAGKQPFDHKLKESILG